MCDQVNCGPGGIRSAYVQLFLVLATGSATGLPGGVVRIAGSERVDERDIP
jgi:hypothetical protein